MDYRYITIGLAMLLSLAAWSVWGYETENVIFMVIDGVRDTEAFEDSTHQYIPHIWNDLRPQGTIYTKYYNAGHTATSSACATFLSGRRQASLVSSVRRSEEPTMFEHYRHQLGIPKKKAWIVCNSSFTIGGSPHSDHPAFGEAYEARSWFGNCVSDTVTAEKLYEVMETDHPSLCMAWFKEVDWAGHEGNWERYTATIKYVDKVAYHLWEMIESDTIYAGKTTLIVTADHGRNDTLHGGFQDHGCPCHGCRHILFLALGPDIKADTVIEEYGYQIDVAPTIAELLGFEMPMADGRVLHEMLIGPEEPLPPHRRTERSCSGTTWSDDAARLTETPQISRDPSICGYDGTFHVVWLERNTDIVRESWETWYTTTDDPFTHTLLFDSGKKRTPIWAAIEGDEEVGLYVSIAYRAWARDWTGGHPTYLCGIGGRGMGEGEPWSKMEKCTAACFQVFSNGISLDIDAGEIYVVEQNHVLQPVLAWQRNPDTPWHWMYTGTPGKGKTFEYPRLSVTDSIIHLGWTTNRWDLFSPMYLRIKGPNDCKLRELGEGGTSTVRQMSIDADGQLVVACWAQVAGDHWEVYWRRSTDGGYTWLDQASPLSSSGVGGWRPDVVVVGELVYVVWEDYRDGNGEIYVKVSYDGGETWSSDIRLTEEESYSIRPQMAVMGDVAYAVWQDLRDGNWEIYGMPIPLSVEEGEWGLR